MSLEVLFSMEATFPAQNVIQLRMPRTTVRKKTQRRPRPSRLATVLTSYSPTTPKIRRAVHLLCRELDQLHRFERSYTHWKKHVTTSKDCCARLCRSVAGRVQ